jgi:hypothetical protein
VTPMSAQLAAWVVVAVGTTGICYHLGLAIPEKAEDGVLAAKLALAGVLVSLAPVQYVWWEGFARAQLERL